MIAIISTLAVLTAAALAVGVLQSEWPAICRHRRALGSMSVAAALDLHGDDHDL